MSSCPVCGSSMVKFRNPDREECPKQGSHARIQGGLAREKMGESGKKTGEGNKGKKRPEAEKNLGKHGRKGKR